MVDDAGTTGDFYAEEPGAGAALDRYRTLVNAVGDGIYQLDPDGRFVAVNDTFCAVTGYDREELLGRHLSLVFDDPDVARIEAMIHSMLAHDLDGRPVDVPLKTKAGEVIPCELQLEVLAADGDLEATVGVIRDVSGRARLDSTVSTVTGRYESLVKDVLDGAGVGVVVVDAEGTVSWLNEAAEAYFGMDRADVIGRDEDYVFEEYVREAVADPEGFAAAHGTTADAEAAVECQIVPGDGRDHRWLVHRSNPVETGRYEGGRVDLYYDVTDRKQTEQVAADRERRLSAEQAFTESLLDAQPDIVYAVDADGRPLRWNDRLCEVTGYSDAEIAWMDTIDFVAEDARERATAAIEHVVESGECDTVELPIETADGERIPYQFSATPLVDENGDTVGLTGVGRDISHLKAQNRRLERQRDELEAELQEVFDRIDDAFFALDEELRFSYLNDRAERVLSVRAGDVIGGDVREGEHLTEEIVEAVVAAFEAQEQVTVEDYVPSLSAWIECHVYPSETGVSVYFRDVTEREQRKQALEDQRERLAALDDLNGVVREVTDAVLEKSTREQIERAVVESLVESNSYAAAWIGDAEPGGDAVEVHAAAGLDEPDADATTRIDPADAGRFLATAMETGEMEVCQNGEGDCPTPPGADGSTVAFRSSAAIPINHQETRYGVLVVHTEREGAFSAEEREVIGQLGEIVGHAIAALERKRALTSDEVIEVDFVVQGAFDELPGVDGPATGITFEQTVQVGDGQYHRYGTATEAGLATLEAFPDVLEYVTGVRTVTGESDPTAFELHLTEPPLATALASRGGTISSAVIEDGTYRFTVQVPPGVPIRTVKAVVQDEYPDATLLAQRQVTRASDTAHRVLSTLSAELTDRQRAVLETSYFGGYFEWPRKSTGEELADSLDIAPATFSQHLRTGQRRLFGALFDDESGESRPRD